MTRPPYLTKSRFKLATECPRKLYYTGKLDYANTRANDEFLQSLAQGGYQVGELAKLMFPGAREITADGHAAQLAATHAALGAERVTLFEAALAHERLFARIDVLVKDGAEVRVIEVKSKSYDPEDPYAFKGKKCGYAGDMLPYLLDVTFQTLIARKSLPDCRVTAGLMMPDKRRRATIAGLNQLFPIQRLEADEGRIAVRVRPGLALSDLGDPVLTLVDVTPYVDELLSGVLTFPGAEGKLETLALQWAHAYEADDTIAAPVQAHCRRCEFRAPRDSELRCGLTECWQSAFGLDAATLREPLVIDLWDGRRADAWLKSGRRLLRELTRDDLGKEGNGDKPGLGRIGRQWLQVSGEGLDDRGYYFDRALAADTMAQWRYPLNLIDFETSRTALPFHRGDRPFGLVAFQFSHHVLQADGTLVHAGEFLCTEPGRQPNPDFLRALQASLARNDGSVMMWSPYERSVLNELRGQLEAGALRDFVTSLLPGGTRAMIDLCELSAAVFFHRRAGGSSSIKKTLPAMLTASAWLKSTYEQPHYGGGRPNSRNFTEPMVWWRAGADGLPIDPYRLLPPVFQDLALSETDEDPTLAQGGAALMAYARLQFETVDPCQREAWKRALLRYCELDTLAMAMIVQGWRAWLA